MSKYQNRPVTILGNDPLKQGDAGYDASKAPQVRVRHDDGPNKGSEEVVARNEVTPA